MHDDTIYAHLMNHSAVKVGSCLTLLGLIKAVEGVKEVVSVTDELLAIAAMTFIVSGAATYIALKNEAVVVKARAGRVGDVMFSGGMLLLLAICFVLIFELS